MGVVSLVISSGALGLLSRLPVCFYLLLPLAPSYALLSLSLSSLPVCLTSCLCPGDLASWCRYRKGKKSILGNLWWEMHQECMASDHQGGVWREHSAGAPHVIIVVDRSIHHEELSKIQIVVAPCRTSLCSAQSVAFVFPGVAPQGDRRGEPHQTPALSATLPSVLPHESVCQR